MQRTIEKIHQLDFLLIFFFIFLSLSRKKQPHHRTAYSPGARCYPSLFFYLPIIYLYLYAQYHKLCVSINHHTLLPSNHKHHRIRHHNPISKIFFPLVRKIIGIIVIIHIVGICLFQRTGTTGMPESATRTGSTGISVKAA